MRKCCRKASARLDTAITDVLQTREMALVEYSLPMEGVRFERASTLEEDELIEVVRVTARKRKTGLRLIMRASDILTSQISYDEMMERLAWLVVPTLGIGASSTFSTMACAAPPSPMPIRRTPTRRGVWRRFRPLI